MKRSQPEYALTVAVADFFRIVLPPEVLWFHVPNGEARSSLAGARLKRAGVRPGVADFMLSWFDKPAQRPRVVWIELKAPLGRVSKSQVDFKYLAWQSGHHWEDAKSLAQVEDILHRHHAPMRGKIAA